MKTMLFWALANAFFAVLNLAFFYQHPLNIVVGLLNVVVAGLCTQGYLEQRRWSR